MANGYSMKTNNCATFKWKAKEKWCTPQVKLQVKNNSPMKKTKTACCIYFNIIINLTYDRAPTGSGTESEDNEYEDEATRPPPPTHTTHTRHSNHTSCSTKVEHSKRPKAYHKWTGGMF